MNFKHIYQKCFYVLPCCGLAGMKLMKDNYEKEINDSYKNSFLNPKTKNVKYSNTTAVRENCIEKANDIITRYKEVCGIPGLAVSVNIDGENIWSQGYGYSDVENLTPCTPTSVFRVASISKAFTSILFGQLMDEKLIDIDAAIQSYVKSFPIKYINGKPVTITSRQLITHLAGIRHYNKVEEKKDESNNVSSDTSNPEFYIKEHYNTVQDSLCLFENDPLHHAPGTKFLYTSYGFNLLSAIIENCANSGNSTSDKVVSFPTLMSILFAKLGMDDSFAEENNPLIMRRVRYYRRVARGQLENTPYVDNSYKWAGGGFLSTVEDLCRFGSILSRIYTGQLINNSIISRESLTQLWSPHAPTCEHSRGRLWYKDGVYAMGWCVVQPQSSDTPPSDRLLLSHTGGAVGASSVLLISIPVKDSCDRAVSRGVIVVALLTNLQDASGVGKVGRKIAKIFAENYSMEREC